MTGSAQLEPGLPQVVWTGAGPGIVTELSVDLPPSEWSEVRATLTFDLTVSGEPAGGSDFTLGNEFRRWAERDFALPTDESGGGFEFFGVSALPAGAAGEFTAFGFALLCRGAGGEIFADGFETGDGSGWWAARREALRSEPVIDASNPAGLEFARDEAR